MRASLAAPSTGAAASRHNSAPSRTPATAVRATLGITRTFIRVPADVLARLSGVPGVECADMTSARTVAKDGRADSNDRGTFVDRDFEVVAHPH